MVACDDIFNKIIADLKVLVSKRFMFKKVKC